MFASQYLAYETLSPGLQEMLSGLKAVHSNRMDYGGESVRIGAIGQDRAPTSEDRRFSDLTYERNHNLDVVETEHPVVRTHPETGRKYLFVNRAFAVRFAGMTKEESLPLLEQLWAHASRPEFTCRYRWTTNTVGLWDNRCALHYALNDYYGERRTMYRVAVEDGERRA